MIVFKACCSIHRAFQESWIHVSHEYEIVGKRVLEISCHNTFWDHIHTDSPCDRYIERCFYAVHRYMEYSLRIGEEWWIDSIPFTPEYETYISFRFSFSDFPSVIMKEFKNIVTLRCELKRIDDCSPLYELRKEYKRIFIVFPRDRFFRAESRFRNFFPWWSTRISCQIDAIPSCSICAPKEWTDILERTYIMEEKRLHRVYDRKNIHYENMYDSYSSKRMEIVLSQHSQ